MADQVSPSASGGTRRVVTLALTFLLAVVSATIASIGVWGQVVLLGSGGSERYVSRIMESPNVVRGIGEHLGDELVALYDENISFASRVPEALKEEAAKLDLTITEEIRERSMVVAASESVRAAVTDALTEAHAAIVDSLTTEPADGESGVRLNLVPAVSALFRSLQESGAWPASPAVPDVDTSATPEQQVATLEEAIGFDLPDGLSSVRLLDGGGDRTDLEEARGWVSSATFLTWIAGVAFVVMTAVAAFTRRSTRARMWVVVGVVVAASASVWSITKTLPPRLGAQIEDAAWSAATVDIVSALVSPLSVASVVTPAIVVAVGGFAEVVFRRQHSQTAQRRGSL